MYLLGRRRNPARPSVQLLGVAEPKLIRPVAETLRALGVERALVVHGSGLDEVAMHGFTEAIRLSRGQLEPIEITPEQAGLERRPVEAIAGGTPTNNAALLTALLGGKGPPAHGDVVSLNAGALLATAGLAQDLAQGVEQARDAIGSGAAKRLLDAFVDASNG
jgi:anthranilate phosphoribosyltransferase